MAEIKERASRYRRLQNDEAYQEMLSDIKDMQTDVFLDSSANMEAIEQAHTIVKGLAWIERYVQSVIDAEKMYDKKHS